MQSLVAIALVVTQLLSWSVAPIYLCVERDGSISIDSGPDGCDCHHDEATHDHAGGQVMAHEHATAGDQDCGPAERCDCTHIQISEPQEPAVLQSAVVLLSLEIAVVCGPATNAPTAAVVERDTARNVLELSSPAARPMSGERCAPLRC